MKEQIKIIANTLRANKKSISFAESCTGGRIASLFTSLPGISDIFNGSCVTYSNDIKHEWLGVSRELLHKYGAVSKECTKQMCLGIQEHANSDYSIAVSGVAGPTGGTKEKPVGTVCIAVGLNNQIEVKMFHFQGARESIQEQSVAVSIDLFAKFLKKTK